MSLPNTTLWGNILPGGIPGELADGSIDTTQVIDDLLPTLHTADRAGLTFWTEGDLIQWLDEALKRLSRVAGVFVGRWTNVLTVAGQLIYSLPPRHVCTLHVSYQATPLRPAASLELEAKDPSYQTTQGTPDHWYQDLQGGLVFGVVPVPNTSDQPLPIIYNGFPETLDAAKQNTLVAAPPPLKGYLAMCVLAEALGREGESEMPDVAKHCAGRISMYEQIFAAYYGKGI